MRYACLVFLDEARLEALSDTERASLRRESVAWEEDLRRRGHLVDAQPFESVRTATTVRFREGRPIAIDGPATEAAEQLERVLEVEARDLNEAMRVAVTHPAGRLGSIEIRPFRRTGNVGAQDG